VGSERRGLPDTGARLRREHTRASDRRGTLHAQPLDRCRIGTDSKTDDSIHTCLETAHFVFQPNLVGSVGDPGRWSLVRDRRSCGGAAVGGNWGRNTGGGCGFRPLPCSCIGSPGLRVQRSETAWRAAARSYPRRCPRGPLAESCGRTGRNRRTVDVARTLTTLVNAGASR
jgi:hypothetical protein